MIGSPLNLKILLHYYTINEKYHDSLASREGTKYLVDQGMLDREDFPAVTEKGIFYINYLMNIPFPVQNWSMPE